MTVELIILDADHTLYTPVGEHAYTELFDALAGAAGVPRSEAEAVWDEHYPGIRASWSGGEDYRKTAIRAALDALDVSPPETRIEALYIRFWDRVAADLEVEEGTRAMLERLAEDHTVAVATDEFPTPLQRKLDAAFDGAALFDAIITPRETDRLKPSTRFYAPLLDRFDVSPSQAMMVGDSWRRDLAPAADMGLTTVHVAGEGTDADHCIDRITSLTAALGDG